MVGNSFESTSNSSVKSGFEYTHEDGSKQFAENAEVARDLCPVLGKMALDQVQMLLELSAIGQAVLDEEASETTSTPFDVFAEETAGESPEQQLTESTPAEVVEKKDDAKPVEATISSSEVDVEKEAEIVAEDKPRPVAIVASGAIIEPPQKPSPLAKARDIAKPKFKQDAPAQQSDELPASKHEDGPLVDPTPRTLSSLESVKSIAEEISVAEETPLIIEIIEANQPIQQRPASISELVLKEVIEDTPFKEAMAEEEPTPEEPAEVTISPVTQFNQVLKTITTPVISVETLETVKPTELTKDEQAPVIVNALSEHLSVMSEEEEAEITPLIEDIVQAIDTLVALEETKSDEIYVTIAEDSLEREINTLLDTLAITHSREDVTSFATSLRKVTENANPDESILETALEDATDIGTYEQKQAGQHGSLASTLTEIERSIGRLIGKIALFSAGHKPVQEVSA